MTDGNGRTVRLSLDLPLDASAAFDLLVGEIEVALARDGLVIERRVDGRVLQDEVEVGRIREWTPGERVRIDWRAASWQPDDASEVELSVTPAGAGSVATLEHRGWGRPIGTAGELTGWFASAVAAPYLASVAPRAFGDWLTDRGARRPSGAQARATYRDPLYHYPGFRAMLDELALTADDHLIEVACGGGALLKLALASGCRAASVDHSLDMVRTAREVNADAIAAGRLEIHLARADRLPFPDAAFTCAALTGALGFLPDPVSALSEIRRVLAAGGRVVVAGSDPELRGTPAAPEPVASRLRFYDDEGLERIGRESGFASVRVVRRDLQEYAREAGVPEEHVPLFGPSRFLVARKGGGPPVGR